MPVKEFDWNPVTRNLGIFQVLLSGLLTANHARLLGLFFLDKRWHQKSGRQKTFGGHRSHREVFVILHKISEESEEL